ncbi:MAG: Two-component hybrid sensor and regulator [Actinobacteria bacterium 66_15]|nr:MAG: Two-component hybrid sensor and regulator [Actinobacteria bacterium 66_15]
MPTNDDRRCFSHIRALMAGTREGMIAVAPDHTVRVLNEPAAEMLGLERTECVGAPSSVLGVPEFVPALKSAAAEWELVSSTFERAGHSYSFTVAPYTEDGGGTGTVITVRDDTELLAVRRRSEAILLSTSDGMLVFDAEDRLTFVNPAAEKILGRGAETLVGLKTDTWEVFGIAPDPAGPVREAGTQVREVRMEEPEHRIVDVRVDPVYDDRESYVGSVATIRDVTSEREAMQMKNEFVSTVSHELRTPLTSIKGYIDLILDGEAGEINEIQQEFLSIVKENSDRLVELINDMLDISRIESGRIVLKVQPLDVGERIAGAVNTFRAVTDQQGRTIHVDVPDDLPKAAGDPDRIGQVLINFVSNAIKYSPEGGDVHIRASVDDGCVKIAISDEGIGISPENQARLFTKFYRVDSSLTREIGGTGLGLSICKSIIELLGGQVGVDSEEGEGSTFWFTLPFASDRHVRTPSLEGPLGSPGGRVLVVDDCEDVANLIATYLSHRGYEVVKAYNANEAWEYAVEFEPRVITLDVMVEEGAGFRLLEELKADPRTKDIPVVVLSIICDEAKSARSGATDYLEKPIDKTRLMDMIDTLVGSISSPLVLVTDDDRNIVDLLTRTLKQRGYAVMGAYNGKEAMAAVARRRPDAILLDLRMPVMDGYEVLQALKNDPDTADIPVVIMSAFQPDRERENVLELASELVGKPFDVEDFISHIESVIVREESVEGTPPESGTA